jgi:hypothetical protein
VVRIYGIKGKSKNSKLFIIVFILFCLFFSLYLALTIDGEVIEKPVPDVEITSEKIFAGYSTPDKCAHTLGKRSLKQ